MLSTLTTKLIAGAVALALVVGAGFYGKHLYDTNAALTVSLRDERAHSAAVQQNLTDTNAAYTAQSVRVSKLTAALAVTQRSLTNALNENATWRDTPVPDDVFNSLYGPANGNPATTTSAR